MYNFDRHNEVRHDVDSSQPLAIGSSDAQCQCILPAGNKGCVKSECDEYAARVCEIDCLKHYIAMTILVSDKVNGYFDNLPDFFKKDILARTAKLKSLPLL